MESLPRICTGTELEALKADPSRWRGALGKLTRKLGMEGAPLSNLGGSNLVVGVGESHVLKLAPPVFSRALERERAALKLVSCGLPLRTPELCATGLHDEWTYLLLTRLPGRPLTECWPEIPDHARRELV